MVTVWSKEAKAELHKAFLYILLDSLQNAEMVRNDIIDATINLSKYPEKHPLDNLKRTMMEHGGRLKSTTIVFHTGLLPMKSE